MMSRSFRGKIKCDHPVIMKMAYVEDGDSIYLESCASVEISFFLVQSSHANCVCSSKSIMKLC